MAQRWFLALVHCRQPFVRRPQVVLAAVLVFTLGFSVFPVGADTGKVSGSGCAAKLPASVENPGPAPAEGLKVYLDPATGELLSEPPPGQVVQPDTATSTQYQGAIAETTRADGTIVADVGDRYVTELRAEIVDGRLVTCHRPPEPDQPLPPVAGSTLERKLNDPP